MSTIASPVIVINLRVTLYNVTILFTSYCYQPPGFTVLFYNTFNGNVHHCLNADVVQPQWLRVITIFVCQCPPLLTCVTTSADHFRAQTSQESAMVPESSGQLVVRCLMFS